MVEDAATIGAIEAAVVPGMFEVLEVVEVLGDAEALGAATRIEEVDVIRVVGIATAVLDLVAIPNFTVA